MGATPYFDTPVVDVAWDGPKAEAGLDNADGQTVYEREYAWVDPAGDPHTKTAYKLPHHEVMNGQPGAANINGVQVALARLNQSSTDIPDADKAAVKAHLDRHVAKWDAKHPADSEPDNDGDDPMKKMSDRISGGLMVQTEGRTWAVSRAMMATLERQHGRIISSHLVDTYATVAARSTTTQTTGGVAVVALKGMIVPQASLLSLLFGGGGGLAQFRSDLHAAAGNADVKAIVLDVDSPGGLVDQVPETAAAIRTARDQKPVVAVANTQAASAAYWLASQAHELVVTDSGELGSIGVYQLHMDESKALERDGMTPTLVSAGKYKVEGNPFEPLSDEGRAYTQQVVDDYYSQFVSAVAQGRGVTTDQVEAGYGQGRVFTARRAVQAGLADRVATLDQTVKRLASGHARVRQTADTNQNAALEWADETSAATYTAEEKERVLSTLAGMR